MDEDYDEIYIDDASAQEIDAAVAAVRGVLNEPEPTWNDLGRPGYKLPGQKIDKIMLDWVSDGHSPKSIIDMLTRDERCELFDKCTGWLTPSAYQRLVDAMSEPQ